MSQACVDTLIRWPLMWNEFQTTVWLLRSGRLVLLGALSGMIASEAKRSALDRVVCPRTVAVVGISDRSFFASGPRRSLAADAEFFFVHPRAETVFGRPTVAALSDIPCAVDVVFAAVRAEETVSVVEQAAALGAGGIVSVATGFAESGAAGAELQRRLASAAAGADMPVIGPNGVGFINVPRKLDLTILADFPRRVGGLSMVSHSGAMVEAFAAAAARAGGVGLNLLFSAGNEAVTDVADYLDYLSQHPGTRVIAVAIETVRRPEAFFAAAFRCKEAGKPIVALKLGRTLRARTMATTHTGAMTDDAWVYDVAFQQAGILPAEDIDDLVDRVQFLEQLPRKRWSRIDGLAVLTATGGFAQLASDLAEVEGLSVPEIDRIKPLIVEKLGRDMSNPLDAGGAGFVPELWQEILHAYVTAPEIDTLLFASQHADWDQGTRALTDGFVEAMRSSAKTAIVAPLAGVGGQWLDEFRADGIGIGNGMRGTFRGLKAMSAFMRQRADKRVLAPRGVSTVIQPAEACIPADVGPILPFTTTMRLLRSVGIKCAAVHSVRPNEPVTRPPFGGPYVVKLADVAHRTEYGAVRVGVELADLARSVAELRTLARDAQLSGSVVVQPFIRGRGEVFVGIQGGAKLGPVVVFGVGGILVELHGRFGGRLAPMSRADAEELIDEVAGPEILGGVRGGPAWDLEALVGTLLASSRLAAGGRAWLNSLDINPLILTEAGPIAVDGLCLVRGSDLTSSDYSPAGKPETAERSA